MHDATSKIEGMCHVNKAINQGLHYMYQGLSHMGMEARSMAMHDGPIKDEDNVYVCMWACMRATNKDKG